MKLRMRAIVIILVISCLAWFSHEARGQAPGAAGSISGKAYNFEKIAEGVYYATATGAMATGSNNTVIVNDTDVLIVDAGITPAAARAFLQDIKLITDKPVRWVVNTHFHYDHTDGNSIFGPDVQIIGHDYVRYAILNLDVLHREPFKTYQMGIPDRIEALKKQVNDEKDPEQRAMLQKQLASAQAESEQVKEIKPTPPTMTYSTKMTLYRGQREIQLLHLGLGHTQGDTIVYLPKERIVCTGDLMESRIAYMGDGMFDDWITTLDALKKMDFDTILPGHGVPFHDKSLITVFQNYMKDLLTQVAALRKQGLSAEETAKKVDLTAYKSDFPQQIQGPGADLRGVRRMYEYLDERAKR